MENKRATPTGGTSTGGSQKSGVGPTTSRQGQFLSVYDPRKRHQRLRYAPIALKPVEEVEAPCSSPSPPPPGSGSSGGPASAQQKQQKTAGMVDSTGCRSAATTAAPDSGTTGEAASGDSSRSVSQEERPGGGAVGGSALSSALPSLGTSREEEGQASDLSEHSSSITGTRRSTQRSARLDRSKSVGERHWANVRAVMALYARLRRIKRTKSNQRWMKLRTTVQLSGAISATIQKKPPLKREDSFLKRFSTRQVAEQQETMDAGEDSEGGAGSGGGLMSQCAAKARRRRRHAQEKRSVVNPDENFYFYWLMVLTGCVLYNLWTLIVRQSFPELQKNIQPIWFLCDAFTDVIFLLDIAVQFRTGYLEQGLMVYNSKKLASHYMHSRAFLLDMSSMLPLDLLQFNLGINPILRFPRFLKVYRIYDYYYMVESRTVYPNLWRVINLVHILLILAHWFGCFYFLLSEAEGFQGEWVYPYRPGDYATLTRKYLGSLYWSTLTLTTIGDLPTPETNADSGGGGAHATSPNASSPRTGAGDTVGHVHSHTSSPPAQPRRGLRSRILQFNSNNGYIFTIVSYLIGVFIFATIVGQVGNVITNRNANRLEFERLLDGAKTYMRHHKVPGDMKRRVLRWYDYSWSRGRIQGGGDINTALGLLPDKLKTELALHVNLSVLKKVTIFQECQPEFLHDLVLKMKAYIFTPGDLICRKGEVAREMFIIADGILEVISETGRVLTTMKAGDFFGEIGILNLDGLNKRTADVRSVGYSELFSLSREDVLAAMKDYPEAQEILQSLGRKRLMEARNVSRAARGGSKRRGSSEAPGAPCAAGDSSDSTGKRIVDKLRSDVKGLKNVLRKSRRSTSHSSKEDSMELQPLTRDSGPRGSTDASITKPPRIKKLLLRSINVESSTSHDSTSGSGSGGKGKVLRRMGRVRSDEATDTPEQADSSQPEVIGAGLPLLQRLLLLKAKEDREEKEQAMMQSKAAVHAPVVPTSSAPSLTTARTSTPTTGEVIGAGLPLMARLRLLKQREDAATVTKANPFTPSSKPTSPPGHSTDCSLSPPSSAEVLSSRPWPLLVNKRSSESGESVKSPPAMPHPVSANKEEKTVTQAQVEEEPPPYESPLSPTNILSPPNKSPAITTISPLSSPPAATSPPVVVSPLSITSPPSVLSPSLLTSPPSVLSPSLLTSPPSLLPPSLLTSPPSVLSPSLLTSSSSVFSHLMLTSPPQIISPVSPPPSVTSPISSSGSDRSPKPSLLNIKRDTKFYQSIDDLSPEYSGLPFVKKLKILNERQKLAALVESSATIRSSSLDSASNPPSEMFPGISRSRSEACDIDYIQRTRGTLMTSNVESEPAELDLLRCESPGTPPSPECNETLERRNLKSILKKLSSSSNSEENKDKPASKIEFRRLLRAQTVEGYAARHSKFAKSVTFNRESASPPPSADILEEGSTLTSAQAKNKINFLLPSILPLEARREEEFFGEVIAGMKTVLQNHMEEIQDKFQSRFQSLEMEVRRRDEIISQLQGRIQELENSAPTSSNIAETQNKRPEGDEECAMVLRNGGGSEDGDISDQEETTYSDQPFMRGDSVDTVITPSNSPIPPDTSSSSSSGSESDMEARDRSASWEERSEEEKLELLELPRSLSPQSLWQHVALDVASSSSSSSDSSTSPSPGHNQDWEVQMLAEELDRRDQRCRLEGELAELAGKSRLSRSELDILDRVLQESSHREVKNRSFDEDPAPTMRRRRRNASETGSSSVEYLNVRGDTLRSSLLRNRLPHKKQAEESSSGIVSWLHRKTSHHQHQHQQPQQAIGKQYLNARSLEEPAGSVERPPHTQGRSSSIGHLPTPSTTRSSGSLFGSFSRLRLSTLSHSLRGFTRPHNVSAAPCQPSSCDTDHSGVATISLQQPSCLEPPS